MPPDDYMNGAQKSFFRALLESTREQLQILNRDAEIGTDDVMAAADPVDRATLEEQRTQAMRERERTHHRIRDVIAALARLDRDEYGYCEGSGEEIGLARLLANPTARYSTEAQARIEQEKRSFRSAA